MGKKSVFKAFKITLALLLVTSFVAMYSLASTDTQTKTDDKGSIPLEAPAFIGVASANESKVSGMTKGTNFLEEEAGISAYINVEQTIDLKKAKTAFRTIEYETDEYIIGSVPLPTYSETEDVHAYVHKDGWIVTYYLKGEVTAKILDWNNYGTDEKIKSTKLGNGLEVIAGAAEVSIKDIKYYHFSYPNANKIMIIADAQWSEGTDTFDIKLPSNFTFYERSYSHYAYDTDGSTLKIDVTQISSISSCDCSITNYGDVSYSLLKPEEFHTVSLWHDEEWDRMGQAFDAIVLVYREA